MHYVCVQFALIDQDMCKTCAVCAHKKKKSLQHLPFPGGHPSKYWAGPTLLIFGDQMKTGAFNVVWS